MWCLRFALILTLLAVLVPRPVQAEGFDGAFTGVIIAHVNTRMADAMVDLVCVHQEGVEAWVVAGFLVPGREGLVYVSNGPWSSPGEVEEYLGSRVAIYPYNMQNDPYLQRVEELFQFTELLFWRIRVVDQGEQDDPQFTQIR